MKAFALVLIGGGLLLSLVPLAIPVRGDLNPSGGITPVTQSGTWTYQLPASSATVITTAATTVVKATSGTLRRVSVTVPVANANIKLFDLAGANCTGTPSTNPKAVILLPPTLGNPFTLEFQQAFVNGICVWTQGATNLTVIYD